ncbi:MAG: YicC/YloC family endoribonuclease [Thermodesulfobacteriota bacterium]|nr:YicC/YloC family endoribonuclease [Thermodesulfobacteriota bacterium]
MIKSMTAYGRGEHTSGKTVFISEIKSVNNRYRDILIHSQRSLQIFEDKIRSLIASRVRRGRIDVSIQIEKNNSETECTLELNRPLVRSYLRMLKQLGDEFGMDQKIRTDYFLQMKDVVLIKPEDMDIDEVRAGLQEVLGQALDSFDMMRGNEGRAIEEDFHKRLQLIQEYIDNIEERIPILVEEYRKRLREKINSISQCIEIDENRLIQEVAILADKIDITEEIARIRSHLKQFRYYMAKDDSIGRRLDFLIQEINREVNTLGAKTLDSSISVMVVEIKAELEKLREQVQNVE